MTLGAILLIVGYAGFLMALAQAGQKTKWRLWIKLAFLIALIPPGAALVFMGGLYLQQKSPTDLARTELRALGKQLAAADEKGDYAAALGLIDAAAKQARQLSDMPGIQEPPLRNCGLAVGHLSDGIKAVAQGRRWGSRDRYDAAMSECR